MRVCVREIVTMPLTAPLRGAAGRQRACGFVSRNWRDGIQPWRPEDAGVMLMFQADRGPGADPPPPNWQKMQYNADYYNEVVISPWTVGAIDAIFLVDCESGEPNRYLGGWRNPLWVPLARSCDAAHRKGREVHESFARAHGGRGVPLVMLRHKHWDWVYAPTA